MIEPVGVFHRSLILASAVVLSGCQSPPAEETPAQTGTQAQHVATSSAISPEVTEEQAYRIARDAYVYAYPLVLMDVFTRQGTNYAQPTGVVTQAPFNQFSHAEAFPPGISRQSSVRTSTRSTLRPTWILDRSQSCCRYRRSIAISCCRF